MEEDTATPTVAERVDRGIAWLDEYYGDVPWRTVIQLDRLDIGSMDNCVFAHLMGSFGTGLMAFREDTGIRDASDYGFDFYTHDGAEEDDVELTAEWKRRLS